MKTNFKIVKIFKEDKLFEASDGKLYRYHVENGKIKVYKKIDTSLSSTKIFERDSRDESRFWKIEKTENKSKLFFKKQDGTLEEVEGQKNIDLAEHLIFGNIALCCTYIRCYGPDGVRNYARKYKVLDANTEEYNDITAQYFSDEKEVKGTIVSNQLKIHIYVEPRHISGSGKNVEIPYNLESHIETEERILWEEITPSFSCKKILSDNVLKN